jgi:pimeloyl-ACP methyl ester carboxylesterase
MTTIRNATFVALSSLVALGAIACSTGSTRPTAAPPDRRPAATTTTVPARPTADVDELVPVDGSGARMHLACSGSGPSTVLLLAGFESAADSWSTVPPALTSVARVCSSDRFGDGTSDAPPRDQTFATQADDLHRVLEVAGEPGPYTVVGHSFGGPEAVTFASRFRGEVTGLMLLDASPTDWPTAACSVPDDGSAMATLFRDTCTHITRPEQNEERLDGDRAFAEVAEVKTLGDLPMRILTRADLTYDGLAAASAQELARIWLDGQDRWAQLSTVSEVVPVHDTSHYIQIDQPAIVIDAIRSLLPTADPAST